MATISLDFDPPDLPTAVTLTGLTRTDTDAAVTLPVPPDFTDEGDGTWSIEFDEPAPGLTYTYTATATWEDATTSPFSGTVDGAPLVSNTPLTRASGWSVVVPPVGRPVTWAELKAAQRVATDAEQTYGELCIDAATEYAQDALSCSLMERTLLATFYAGRAQLPRGPVIAVTAVTDRYDVAIVSYELEHAGNSAFVVPTAGYAYPLSVTYRAGYTSAAAIPADIRRAILAHAGSLFEVRESITERERAPVPHALEAFYALKRRKACVA